MAVALLRALLDKHVNLPRILKAFPGYDGEGLPRSERVQTIAHGEDED